MFRGLTMKSGKGLMLAAVDPSIVRSIEVVASAARCDWRMTVMRCRRLPRCKVVSRSVKHCEALELAKLVPKDYSHERHTRLSPRSKALPVDQRR